MSEQKKVVLAYSGGLDTSVAIKWLQEQGYNVIACCLDVGEGKDLAFVQQKALEVGATNSYVIDAKEEFAQDYALISLQAHTMYEGKYPLVSALSRPLIAKKLVEIAEKEDAQAIAHGCTGKGNDQVRFEVSIKSLNLTLKLSRRFGNGNGHVKKKLNMHQAAAFRFRSILTARILLTKTCGDAQMSAAF